MKLNDIRVAHKLWVTILGLLLLLLAAAAFTQYRAGLAMQNALDDVQRYESNISAAIRWQGLTETNTERSLPRSLVSITSASIPQPKISASSAELRTSLNFLIRFSSQLVI